MQKQKLALAALLACYACGTTPATMDPDAGPLRDGTVADNSVRTDNGIPNNNDGGPQTDAESDSSTTSDSSSNDGSTSNDASGGDAEVLPPLVCTDLPTLNCGDTAVAGTTGASNSIRAYCTTSTTGSYSGSERLYRINIPGTQEAVVTITANTEAGVVGDFDVFTYPSDGTSCAPPTTSTTCRNDTSVGPNATAAFGSSATDHDFIVAYDGYDVPATRMVSYTVSVTCTATTCGDGNRRANEACDDRNTNDGDGCSSTCAIEANYRCSGEVGSASTCVRCGDGNRATAESCDDGNTTAGDGCSATCTIETDFSCVGEVGAQSVCTAIVCGDGNRATRETCDDGNTNGGDGCSPTCTIETNFTCTGAVGSISVCTAIVCGDGNRASRETCDDGNTDAGDGCSPTCTQETNFTCTGAVGAISVCVPNCGNGTRTFSEGCDDGNNAAGDGCSPTCIVEPGYDCSSGSPSVCIVTVCGDGNRRANEACDQLNNTSDGDGCSSTCTVEPGYSCMGDLGFPSTCMRTCGNTTLNSNESCEDSNLISGDGCSDVCRTEPGFVCPTVGMPCIASTHSVAPLSGLTCAADTETWTTATFTSMGASDDAASSILPFPSGFTFSFGGAAITGFSVSGNGFMQLWPSSTGTPSYTFSNTTIPTAAIPNAMVAPLWDDLYPGTAVDALGAVRFAVINGNLVVQWKNWKVGSDGAATTFQVALAPNGVIDFAYCSGFTATGRLSGDSATIGVENADGTGGTQVSHNTAGAVSNGSGYRLTPR